MEKSWAISFICSGLFSEYAHFNTLMHRSKLHTLLRTNSQTDVVDCARLWGGLPKRLLPQKRN